MDLEFKEIPTDLAGAIAIGTHDACEHVMFDNTPAVSCIVIDGTTPHIMCAHCAADYTIQEHPEEPETTLDEDCENFMTNDEDDALDFALAEDTADEDDEDEDDGEVWGENNFANYD